MPNQPTSNATAYCQKGRFLWGKVNNVGDPYFGQLTLPDINLGQPGRYEVVYYVVFSCEGDGCSSSEDSIKVIINDEDENRVEDVTNLDNIGFMKRWMKKSFQFTVADPKIEVLLVNSIIVYIIYLLLFISYWCDIKDLSNKKKSHILLLIRLK